MESEERREREGARQVRAHPCPTLEGFGSRYARVPAVVAAKEPRFLSVAFGGIHPSDVCCGSGQTPSDPFFSHLFCGD